MLPRFPKAQKILDDEFHKQMFGAMHEIFPKEIHPPVQPIVEGKDSDFQRDDREIRPLVVQKHVATATIDTSAGKGATWDILRQKAREVGESMGKQQFEMLIGAVNEAVAETGNEVKIKEGQLTQDAILQLFGMGEQHFDEHGNPTGQLICGTKLAEEFKKREVEWKDDAVFQGKLTELRLRQLEAFNEREARRRLVD